MNFIIRELSTGNFYQVTSINLRDDYCVEIVEIINGEPESRWVGANNFQIYQLVD